ncbi:MAG: tetratricopeptide repeat protein [Chitinophagales bacterium]|nr:tetratricopeptide repeat protein [Chitinophagales bacterium]
MTTQNEKILFSNNSELQELLVRAHSYPDWGGNSANRLKLFKNILQKADMLKLEKEQVHAFALLAKYSIFHEQFSKALEYIFQGLPLAQKHKMNDRISNFYNWLASAHLFAGDYSNALDYYQLEIKYNIENNLEERCYIAYSMIAAIYSDSGNYNAAEQFYEKAVAIEKKYPDYRDVYLSSAQVNTGNIFLKIEKGEYDEAKALCLKTLEKAIAAPVNDGRLLPNLHCSLALICHKTGNYQEGVKHAKEAEKWKDDTDASGQLYIYYVLALNQLGSGNKKEAMLAFDECISRCPLPTDPTSTREIDLLQEAKKFYETIGEREKIKRLNKMISHAEADMQTMQSKLAIRAEQLLAVTAKYAPANPKLNSGKISLWVIGSRITNITVEKIAACQTLQGKENRNTCRIEMIDTHKTYRVPISLRRLYDRISNPDFVWLNRNIFINKKHVEDWARAMHTGRVVLNGNTYDVSRRNLKLLKEQVEI